MSPESFLDVARHLLELMEDGASSHGIEPAALARSAISRAYYACFLLAKDVLDGLYQARWPKGGTGHKMVEDVLKKADDDELKRWGMRFAALRTARRKADYETGDTHIESTSNVRFNLDEAADFLAFLATAQKGDVESRMLTQQLQVALHRYDETYNRR